MLGNKLVSVTKVASVNIGSTSLSKIHLPKPIGPCVKEKCLPHPAYPRMHRGPSEESRGRQRESGKSPNLSLGAGECLHRAVARRSTVASSHLGLWACSSPVASSYPSPPGLCHAATSFLLCTSLCRTKQDPSDPVLSVATLPQLPTRSRSKAGQEDVQGKASSYSQERGFGRTHNTGNPFCVHIVIGELLWVSLGARF